MEAVGLTVGVVGLAGLFSSCLEAVDKVQTYRSFGSDSHVLDTRFKAAKVRFEKWGRRVGFEETMRSEDHHPALDDRDISAAVQDIFQIITTLCDASDASTHYTSRAMTPSDDVSLGSLRPRPHGTRRRKLVWTLWGKTERTDQVELFEKLVQQLHNLVPVDAVQGTRPVHELDTRRTDNLAPRLGAYLNAASMLIPAELQRILARIEEANRAETRRAIHSWLGRGSPNERYHDSVQKRLVGTCDWILHRPAFQNWLDQEFPAGAKLLWINGPAGFGKTILCAHVVEHLSSTLKTPVAHFFFSSDLESREDPVVAVRSWISQVVSQHEGAFEHVRQKWEADSDPVTTRANAVMLFTQILRVVPGCTFIVDGLDECTYLDDRSTSVTKFIETVKKAVVGTNTRVLVVSRAEPEIRTALTDDTPESFAEYKIAPDDVRSDTAAYSKDIVDRKLPNKSDDVRSTLSKAMTDQCEGQFLWLKMQEKSLSSWMNKTQLQHTIEETPAELDQLYDRSWQRITQFREWERQRIYALLRWAAFALRPLTVCEVTEAVLIDESEDLPIEALPDAVDDDYIDKGIVRLCGPLLEVRSQHSDTSAGLRTVHLTHFSVKQYLLCNLPTPGWIRENERLQDEYQNTLLAKACLHYINIQRVWQEAPDH
ncbi:prion-inhibition and propagation-domain-containing protein, partial [Ilyonectria destructans]